MVNLPPPPPQSSDPQERHRRGSFRELIGATTENPCAILFRQVATPNYELRSFLRTSRRLGLKPVVLTYHQDRMTLRNNFKRSLVAPIFVEGINRFTQPIWRRRQIINVETIEKFRLSDLHIDDVRLPDFHRALIRRAIPDEKVTIVEGSDWLSSYSCGPRDYYLDILLGLTGGTVLFETFLTDKEEARFFHSVVRPAFTEATRILKREPSLMPLCTGRRAASPLWYAYPDSYRAHFEALGVKL